MKPNKINERDKQLLKEIRTAVKRNKSDRLLRSYEAKPLFRRRYGWISISLLIIGIGAWYLIGARETDYPEKTTGDSLPGTSVVAQRTDAGTKVNAPSAISKAPPVEKEIERKPPAALAPISQPVSRTSGPPATATGSRPVTPKAHPESENAAVREAPRVASKNSKNSEMASPVAAAKESAANPVFRIADITVCQGVENHRPLSRQSIFSLQAGARPHVWMDVRSSTFPYTLKHVYYFNSEKYCVVPLKIRFPRMRTWSTVTPEPQYAGQWRVDVLTETGSAVASVKFSVVP